MSDRKLIMPVSSMLSVVKEHGIIPNFRTEEEYFDRLPETTTPTPPIHGVPRVINSLIKAAMVLSTIVAIGMLI